MLRSFFILLFFMFLSLNALELNSSNQKYESFEIHYFQDVNSSYNIQTVINEKFKPIHNTNSFSAKPGTLWYKLELTNPSDLQKTLMLHNTLAYYAKEITIYELQEKKLLKEKAFNILLEGDSSQLTGSTLTYKVHIPPQSTLTIIIKNREMISNLFSLKLYSEKKSSDALINSQFYSIIIVTILFSLAFYNATLYAFNRRKEFLLYALYLSAPATGLLYKYGIIYSHFHFYGPTSYWFNLTAIMMPAFLIFFIRELLNTQAMAKKVNLMLNIVLGVIGLNILFALFIDLTLAMEIFKFMFLFTTLVLIYLNVYLFKMGHPLSTIFSLAYGAYIVGLIITILAMSGAIELNFFTFHSGGFGIIAEALLFSYLMHYNVKLLEKKVQDQREVIIAKNKKAQLGDMISAITHQWKQPLSRVASVTTLLEFKLQKEGAINLEEFNEKIQSINHSIHFLSETIDDFKDFFNPNGSAKEYDISKIIESAVKISKENSILHKIQIKTDLEFEHKIYTYKNELLHIILNILQNATEAFKSSNEEIKIIKIFGYNRDNKTYIDIIDNAGGIKEEQLPFIFNENYTNKENESGSGLGLYLSKVILEGHLKGSIEASNTNDGAQFRIIL